MNYLSSIVEKFPDSNEDPDFKIPTPISQQMVDWVKEAFDHVEKSVEMVKRSFEVCGIMTSS